jgi:hypothetical protein
MLKRDVSRELKLKFEGELDGAWAADLIEGVEASTLAVTPKSFRHVLRNPYRLCRDSESRVYSRGRGKEGCIHKLP